MAEDHGNASALKKRDGVSATLEEENKLWKEVMDFLHDADEEELEEEEEEDEEEEEPEADAAVDPAPPGPHPAAGAHTGLTDEELAALEATSVELLPDKEREAALAAAAAKSAAAPKASSNPLPARAGPSGPPSTVGTIPASAETLQAELRKLYRPDQEPVGDYSTQLARVVLALRAYGVNVAARTQEADYEGHTSRRRVWEVRWRLAPYSDGSRPAGQVLGRGAKDVNRGASGRGRVPEGDPGYWRAHPSLGPRKQ